MTVTLPTRSWFYQPQGGWMITNTYTGSLGADPERGIIDRASFNYRVSVEGSADDPSFKASCCVQKICKNRIEKTSQQEKTFDISEEGFAALAEWLDGQYRLFSGNEQS